MGRKKTYPTTEVEMLKAQVLMTETGYPADLVLVEDCYGKAFQAPEPGWFWIGATPKAAADIRQRGLHAVGTVTTTFVPVQDPPKVYDTDKSFVPIVGTQAHADLMLKEKKIQ